MKTKIFTAVTSVLDDKNIFERLYLSVPEWRREKIDSAGTEKAKKLSLGAGLLLVRALDSLGIDCRGSKTAFGKQGKPFFTDMPEVCFSLSHSGKRVMCAVSDRDVGCDVEMIRPGMEKAAKRFFTDGENRLIDSQDGSRGSLEMFFRLWTLKESFMKAVGTGFSVSPADFSISMDADGISVVQDLFNADFHFREYGISGGYCFSCCSLNGDFDGMVFTDLYEI